MTRTLLIVLGSLALFANLAAAEEADLDGDGTDETIRVAKAGLYVGKVLYRVKFPKDVFEGDEVKVEIVDIDRNDEGKEIKLSYPVLAGAEDPGTIQHLLGYRGQSITALLKLSTEFIREIPGDGTVRIGKSAWATCRGTKKVVPLYDSIYGFDKSRRKLVRKSKEKIDDIDCKNPS